MRREEYECVSDEKNQAGGRDGDGEVEVGGMRNMMNQEESCEGCGGEREGTLKQSWGQNKKKDEFDSCNDGN